MDKMVSVCTFYAITPCHSGSGSSTGVVDLPIQRERHTEWPLVASSGLKGAMRAHFDSYYQNFFNPEEKTKAKALTDLVFGSEKNDHAGAISVSDLKILAFPMRSNIAPFVWITSPAVLRRLEKDLKLAGKNRGESNFAPEKNQAISFSSTLNKNILLEDMEVNAKEKELPEHLKDYFKSCKIGDEHHLLVVHDEVFKYGVSKCTAINAQIKIDQKTGTTEKGTLRYQEELPTDTLMYCLVFWGDSRNNKIDDGTDTVPVKYQATTIKENITTEVMKDFIQVGGDLTTGRGIFEVSWY